MKKTFVPTLVLALSLALPAAASEEPGPRPDPPSGPLDLATVLRTVLTANRDLAASRALARAAGEEAAEAAAGRLPRFDLGTSFVHTDEVMGAPPSPPGAGIDPAFFTGWRDQWSVRLSGRQLLYAGGEVSSGIRAARAGAGAAEMEVAERERFLAFRAKDLFYRLLLAQQQLSIAREQLDLSRRHASQAEERFRAGDASRFELLQARVRAENLIQPVASAERARGETATDLSVLMGWDPRPDLQVAGELAVTDDGAPLEIPSGPDPDRPSLLAASRKSEQALWQAETARAARRPRLTLFAQYDTKGDRTDKLFDARNDNWSAGIQLDLNLFDGGAASARVARASSRNEALQWSLELVRENAHLDLARAVLALREARAARASAAQTVAEAEEAAAIARVGYQAGTATHLETVDAEVNLANARTRLTEADYRFLSARALLDYAAGRLPQEALP